ncbi:hypothetical protein EDB92DRAFT_558878 [Lactarius akahatsu]|uniref:Uncharacterized protein n=1 Tax=Lactarius akahatsu TaxID=416441 RepID=A0AAD4L549_9AGAM|nr:hypothetical protein EDB92DRAFT_558878 [Lactarius akahatsu]
MSPGQLVETVQDSKAKRQERLKSRFRDRGGIFVPAEGNDLAQLLLARGVNVRGRPRLPPRRRARLQNELVNPLSFWMQTWRMRTPPCHNRGSCLRARRRTSGVAHQSRRPKPQSRRPQSRGASAAGRKRRRLTLTVVVWMPRSH